MLAEWLVAVVCSSQAQAARMILFSIADRRSHSNEFKWAAVPLSWADFGNAVAGRIVTICHVQGY
jgi:hypothetical protein